MRVDTDCGTRQSRQVADALERIARDLRDGKIAGPLRIAWTQAGKLRLAYETRDGSIPGVVRAMDDLNTSGQDPSG